jgi:D-lactate dehydrogenase
MTFQPLADSSMSKLFSVDASRIGRPDGPVMPDALPESLLRGTPRALRKDLELLLGPAAFFTGRYSWSATPRMRALIATFHKLSLSRRMWGMSPRHSGSAAKTVAMRRFRAAGTSLSGQSQSGDILIDIRKYFSGGVQVEQNGHLLTARSGTILAHANARLARFCRKLGPDPASSHACTLGGVIANNAGAMRCTVARDAYHAVRSLVLTLPSGTTINTATTDAE